MYIYVSYTVGLIYCAYIYRHLTKLMAIIYEMLESIKVFNSCTVSLPLLWMSADPEDFSSALQYNVTFRQTAVTDLQVPARTTVSYSIFSSIVDDDLFESLEYFQARIVETSDRFRVRIGQAAINVTITDSESFIKVKFLLCTFATMMDQLGAKTQQEEFNGQNLLWSKDRY